MAENGRQMAENDRQVRVEIVDILEAGECPIGLEVGRTWLVSDSSAPEGMCSWAWNSMLPFVSALRFGGSFPWSGKREARISCPDADNPVVFLIEVTEE